MKAMVLAAGLGTRLRPLTDNRPKALVEISGRTLLEITLCRLRSFGVSEAIINVHHCADMIVEYLKAKKNFDMRIEVSREDVLLDTGGGLKKAAWFFLEESKLGHPSQMDEPFILHNVDVISTIDIPRMVQFHRENSALATLAVQARETSRYLLFEEQLRLCGRRSSGTAIPGCAPQFTAARNPSALTSPVAQQSTSSSGSPLPQSLAFSGIHVISPRLLPMITEQGIFSIIDTYLRLAAQGQKILAFRADEYYWRDLGRPADLAQAAQDISARIFRE